MNNIKSSLNDVNNKIDAEFDRLMLLIIGGAVLKGGIDFYQGERKNSMYR